MASPAEANMLKEVIAPIVNFLLFVIILYFSVRKALPAAALKKKEDFLDLLKGSQAAKKEAEENLAKLKQRFENINNEVTEIKTLAKTSVENEAKAMVQDAKTLAEHLQSEAARIADSEVEKAKREIAVEIIEQVSQNVASKLKNDLDESKHNQFSTNKVTQLESMN